MPIAHFFSSGFDGLPFPLIGNLLLVAVTLGAVALAWALKLRLAIGLLLAFTFIVAMAAIAVEFDYGRGDGFGQLFVFFLIAGLALYFAVTALICKAIAGYRRRRLGRTSSWDEV